MIFCPICHARIQTEGKEKEPCQRCKSNLADLFKIKQEAYQWLCHAYHCFINGKKNKSLVCVENALDLYNTLLGRMFLLFLQKTNAFKDI